MDILHRKLCALHFIYAQNGKYERKQQQQQQK